MKTMHWKSLIVPLDGLSQSANWLVTARAVEDRIVGQLLGIPTRDSIAVYARTESMPSDDYYSDSATYEKEVENEARTLLNYNESLPNYARAMERLSDYVGHDYQIADTSDRAIVVLIEATK